MLPAALPVPTLAVTPVTDVAMILVPVVPRIIPAAKPVQPSADRFAVTAIHHAQAEALLTADQLWGTMNAAAPAGLVRLPARQELLPPTPAVAAGRPQMNAERKHVIILINHAVLILLMLPVNTAAHLLVLAVRHADHAIPAMIANPAHPQGKKIATAGVILTGTVLTSTMSGAELSTNVRPIPAIKNHGKLIVMPAAVITAGQPAMRLVRE